MTIRSEVPTNSWVTAKQSSNLKVVLELTRCKVVMLEPEVHQLENGCHREQHNNRPPWRLSTVTNIVAQKIFRAGFRDIQSQINQAKCKCILPQCHVGNRTCT